MPAPVVAAAAAPSLLSWFATPTGIGLSTLLGLGTTGYFMAGGGQPSEEEQERMLRRQLEIQDEFERKRAGQMGDLGGLVGGGQMSLSDLIAEEALTRKAAGAGRALERLSQARPRYMDELEQIIGGQSARIAALQSERTMTPLEIIQMVEGGFG